MASALKLSLYSVLFFAHGKLLFRWLVYQIFPSVFFSIYHSIPGAVFDNKGNGVVVIDLPDGTRVNTYPGRTSTGKPGWSITKPGKKKPAITSLGYLSPYDAFCADPRLKTKSRCSSKIEP
jgi:hypothetical protein